MHVFFAPDAESNLISLDESESGHAVRVLRMTTGDQAIILDGRGHRMEGELMDPHPKRCTFSVSKKEYIERNKYHLHIAIAPTKLNDRMEWFLEKATEIGIEEITPVICHRSERRVVNHERFTKVLIAAMKQSLNPWMPQLNSQVAFDDFIEQNKSGYIAHCLPGNKTSVRNISTDKNIISILIGPEGDFTEQEVSRAEAKGWLPLTLGDSRLRTETAGLVACTAVRLGLS